MTALEFAAVADALGWRDSEFVQMARQSTMPPEQATELGMPEGELRFRARVFPVPDLRERPDAETGRGTNHWFGPCPVDPHYLDRRPDVIDQSTGVTRRPRGGRPNKHDITRLAGVWVDLDFKHPFAGGCRDRPTAEKIIHEISALYGVTPGLTVASGHGLQAIWAIEDGDIGPGFTTEDANTLLARHGEFVAGCAPGSTPVWTTCSRRPGCCGCPARSTTSSRTNRSRW